MKWIYLQQILGYGAKNARKVIRKLGKNFNPATLNAQSAKEIGLLPWQCERIGDKTFREAERIKKLCENNGVTVCDYYSTDYPAKFRTMYDCPTVVYYCGKNIDFNNSACIASVGTRKISERGKQSAFSLSARLALCGAVIISGGAVGGDAFSHLGALAVGGKTVALTGGGVISDYLKTNEYLRNDIIKSGGMLLSEFAPDYVPRAKNSFAIRNRLIASLCDTAVVVETTNSGGSLITANDVLKAKKTLYVIKSENPNDGADLLSEKGAKILVNAQDVLQGLNHVNTENIGNISPSDLKVRYTEAKKKTDTAPTAKRTIPAPKRAQSTKSVQKIPTDINLDATMQSVLNFANNPVTVDEICEQTALSVTDVMIAVTKLEISGLIKAVPGSRYIATKQ